MNWINRISYFLICLSFLQTANAAVPVTMSNSVPAIPGNHDAGTSNTYIYTITNNVPKKSFPITVSGISNPVTRTTVINDCGNALPPGPSICNIGVLIAPTSGNAGNSINQNLSVDYQGRRPLTQNIAFSVPSSLGPAVLTAAGADLTGSQPPLLAVSNDSGNTWATKTVTNLPASGSFNGASCTGSGSNAICTAVGNDTTGSGPPLVAISTDGGNTWTTKTVTNLPATGSFFGTSCTGSGSNAICTAAGNDFAGHPLLAVSTDGGNTWATKTVTNLPASGTFNGGTSCTGSGSNAICTAAGDTSGSGPPLLAISTDGGNTWATKTITNLPAIGYFYGTSCTGSGSNAICTAVGQNITGSTLVAISTDGGNTWATKTVTNVPAFGLFNATSCTGSGSNAICTAVGRDGTGSVPPLVAISTDGGNTWATKTVTNLPANGGFTGTSCTGSGSNAICTAVGQDLTGITAPLLAISTDGGNTWATKTVTNLPASGTFNGTSCTGSGSHAICTAVGQDTTGSAPPLLAISTDGGNTWATKTITNLPPSGYFAGTGATGGTLTINQRLNHQRFGVEPVLEKLIKSF